MKAIKHLALVPLALVLALLTIALAPVGILLLSLKELFKQ